MTDQAPRPSFALPPGIAVPADGELIASAQRTRASWELRKGAGVAAYAIQGRRPHMEDRFNAVAELEHTRTSIYGVFDGHGGDVSAPLATQVARQIRSYVF